MVNIITIEREYGCGGGDIARLVANRLGWQVWDQKMTEEIARLAHCPKSVVESREEKNDPLYYRLFKSFLRGSYEGSINAPNLNLVDSETILKITRRVASWAEAHNSFSGTGRTLCGSFYMLQGNIKSGGLLAVARAKRTQKNWWIPSTVNAPISFRNISIPNGPTVRYITAC
jgi:Cytidylate kinase-like family